MSNIYILEPPTSGKVLLKTSVGDIEVELWAKEAPKTCRNFIQLCLEGYYDGTIFHRVVKDFIVQGGDPKGDGTGGESIYDEPFKDEFHQRLRFVRRGLLAMANAGKDDNGSQFFFTLAPAPELQNKHTIFGKVVGDTLFNMLKLSEGLIEDERPVYPHKVISIEVLHNPFGDIIPRAKKVKKSSEEKGKKKREPGVKNFKLLSFGEEAEEDEEEVIVENKKYAGKSKSTHDVLNDPKLSSLSAEDAAQEKEEIKELEDEDDEEDEDEKDEEEKDEQENDEKEDDEEEDDKKEDNEEEDEEDVPKVDTQKQLENIRKKLKVERKKKPVQKEYLTIEEEEEIEQKKRKREEIRMEIENLKRDYHKNKLRKIEMEKQEKNEQEKKEEAVNEYKEQYLKYKEKKKEFPKKGAGREQYTLALLSKFKKKLAHAKEAEELKAQMEADKLQEEKDKEAEDDEDAWMNHQLHFENDEPVLAKDANTKDDDWFEIYDPRNPLNKRRRGETTDKKI